jgi:hypothetical protein
VSLKTGLWSSYVGMEGFFGRSRWSCGPKRRPSDTSLLGSRVPVSLMAWMFVLLSVVCVAEPATRWSLIQSNATGVRAFVYVCVCVSNNVWSRNLKHEAILAQVGLLHHSKKVLCKSRYQIPSVICRFHLQNCVRYVSVPCFTPCFIDFFSCYLDFQ